MLYLLFFKNNCQNYYHKFYQFLKQYFRIKFIKYLFLALIIISTIILNITESTKVQAAISSTNSSSITSSNISTLLQEGKKHYQAGRYNEAVILWEQVKNNLIQQGNKLNQAVVSSNLALAYQQMGKWDLANKAISESLNILLPLSSQGWQSKIQNLLAESLNIQGSLLLSQGQPEKALDSWKKTNSVYEKLGDKIGVSKSLLNQTQAMRAMGLYRHAKTTLEKVNQILKNQPDSSLKVIALVNLGDNLRTSGDLKTSKQALQQGLQIAQKLQSSSDITLSLLSLGNTARLSQQPEEALNYYQQAITTSPTLITKLQAQLNQLRLLLETKKRQEAEVLISQIQPQFQNLPPSRTSIYARVNFVQSLIKATGKDLGTDKKPEISETSSFTSISNSELVKILADGAKQADAIGDKRAQSYALGHLGQLYERNQQYTDAQKLTEKALFLAQTTNAADIAYRWQWQLGRLLKNNNKLDEAIISYGEAVKTLGYIRQDLVASNLDVQFSFRESVEPVYRELVSLLLTPQIMKGNKEVEQRNLKKAREVIESLQLAELDNYFKEACLTARPQQIDQIDSQAAVIYPIILSERLEVIVSIPNQPLHHYTAAISEQDAEKIFEKMRHSMRRTSLEKERLHIAQKVYDLVIKPAEEDFTKNNIKTLAFVLDGAMKNIPMAALYDGQHYLVEKYSLALTPGLQLLAPRPLEKNQLKVLVGGLSESRQGFISLPGVETEVKEIKSEISSQILLNQTFTGKQLQKKISSTSFPIVHLATHGQFSSHPEDTFIVTWDNRIDVKQLGELLQSREQENRRPIELLVLSACQTADGDKRAALGLAGVAVKSGARSTVASLWPVDDQSTSLLMLEFYSKLNQPQFTKAKALQNAQLALMKQPNFKHPYYWAPFVMVGNWL
jgi:CHAT domain-containing protein